MEKLSRELRGQTFQELPSAGEFWSLSTLTRDEEMDVDLMLKADFDPSTIPPGCSRAKYREYFRLGKIFLISSTKEYGLLSDTTQLIPALIEQVKPDAVILPLPSSLRALLEEYPEGFAEEVAVAYLQAKDTENCEVVLGDLPIEALLKELGQPVEANEGSTSGQVDLSDWDKWAVVGDRIRQAMQTASWAKRLDIEHKRDLHMTYVFKKVLDRRTNEKYLRIREIGGTPVPCRIVAITNAEDATVFNDIWDTPVEELEAELGALLRTAPANEQP